MNLLLPISLSDGYNSPSQRIRVMTECWVNETIFCPNCGKRLTNFQNNRPVADFYCEGCLEEFELKSKGGKFGSRIVDGAYSSMVQRLKANNNANFFFLSYDNKYLIHNFVVIPKYFFVPSIIEKRPPLRENARRAGWIGCNILLNGIPDLGKIYYVHSGVVIRKNEVLEKWRRTEFIKETRDIDAKGWLLDVLSCVEKIKKEEFSLTEVYQYEAELKKKHPLNNNIQPKIRQQLQFLRDKGIIDFAGHGTYRVR